MERPVARTSTDLNALIQVDESSRSPPSTAEQQLVPSALRRWVTSAFCCSCYVEFVKCKICWEMWCFTFILSSMTYFTVQQSICKPLLQHIYIINCWMTFLCSVFYLFTVWTQQQQMSGSRAGCCQDDAASHWVFTRCVTCRVFGASPNTDGAEASSPQTAAADKTCRLPKRCRLPACCRGFFAAGLQLPVAEWINEDSKIKDSTTLTRHLWAQIDLIKRSFLSKCKCLRDCRITCVSQPNGRFWTSMCYCRIVLGAFRSSHQ